MCFWGIEFWKFLWRGVLSDLIDEALDAIEGDCVGVFRLLER
jgi:hypothetical protein